MLDATKYGPRCPQREDTGRSNRKHLWDGIAAPSNTIPTDEFECLNLNVYAPVNKTEGKGVPVFVWIHGGAWTWGDGAADYGEFWSFFHFFLGLVFVDCRIAGFPSKRWVEGYWRNEWLISALL